MGSKTEVLDLIENGINYLGRDYENVCDLFAGSATLSGALRNNARVISNDIHSYSSVFASTYLSNYQWDKYPDIQEICGAADERTRRFNQYFSEYAGRFSYDREFTLDELNTYEQEQRDLINIEGWDVFDQYYLFAKNYAGTYWSYDQCVAIDSYRCIIDRYRDDPAYYNLLLTCLIYAMAYNSQSTGHYAQYRIPENDSSKEDILIYRRKNIKDFFVRKYVELESFLNDNNYYEFETMALKDTECLARLPEKTLVYADPPYCFVHYSRFYHILETMVRYDYPELRFKGRYRTDRYQSDYCIKTEVTDAFCDMFDGVRNSHSDLILSYTNSETNTIAFEELLRACCTHFNPECNMEEVLPRCLQRGSRFFGNQKKDTVLVLGAEDVPGLEYEISMIKKPYNHSRMGRKETKSIPVTEVVIISKYVG
ncbi:MAG: DNA adenine methylase [Lachnospiraceae bacterium]|nr:DNA adenine methylase [Lachnospiraceae bacterium]